MLAVSPIMRNGMKEMRTAKGIVMMGMMALGMCHRNSRMTSATVTITSNSVDFTLPMECWINSDRS